MEKHTRIATHRAHTHTHTLYKNICERLKFDQDKPNPRKKETTEKLISEIERTLVGKCGSEIEWSPLT